MGGGRGSARGAPARLQSEHRFLLRNAGGELAEILGIADRFHVKENLRDVRFVFPVFEGVFGVDVRLVPDRNELREAQVEVAQNIENPAPEGARLAYEPDVTAFGEAFRKASVKTNGGMGVDDAEAVGPDQTHAVAADLLGKFRFKRGSFGARFLEARGNHDETANALRVAVVHDRQNGARINDDDREIHSVGQVRDAFENAQPLDRAPFGVHGIDGTAETVLEEALQDVVADRVRTGRRADDGDGAGLHDVGKTHDGENPPEWGRRLGRSGRSEKDRSRPKPATGRKPEMRRTQRMRCGAVGRLREATFSSAFGTANSSDNSTAGALRATSGPPRARALARSRWGDSPRVRLRDRRGVREGRSKKRDEKPRRASLRGEMLRAFCYASSLSRASAVSTKTVATIGVKRSLKSKLG